MAQTNYKVGDMVFFSTGDGTVAGKGMFIGQLKNSPDNLVLVIGKQIVEVAAQHCTPTRGGFPSEGASSRRDYLKQHPDSLQFLSWVPVLRRSSPCWESTEQNPPSLTRSVFSRRGGTTTCSAAERQLEVFWAQVQIILYRCTHLNIVAVSCEWPDPDETWIRRVVTAEDPISAEHWFPALTCLAILLLEKSRTPGRATIKLIKISTRHIPAHLSYTRATQPVSNSKGRLFDIDQQEMGQ